jgi:hypothetical protein
MLPPPANLSSGDRLEANPVPGPGSAALCILNLAQVIRG